MSETLTVSTARANYVLGVLTVITALNYFDRAVLSLVLPLVKQDLQVSDTAMGFASGLAFVLFYALMGVPIARLADRWNRRNIIAIGLVFWSVMTCLTGLAANIWQLALCRFLMGAGEASGMAPSNAMLADLFSKERRPLASSILAAGATSSGIVLVPLAGWIAQHYGWRMAFIVAGLPGLAMAAILALTVAEPARGSVAPATDALGPTLRFLLGARSYQLMLIGGSLVGVSVYGGGAWNATFMVRVHGLTIGQVGSILGPIVGAAGIAGGLLGGFLADRLGRGDERWRLWVPGLACLASGPAILAFLFAPTTSLAFMGLGAATLFTTMQLGPMYAACMAVARPRMRAVSIATMLLCVSLVGQIFGPVAVGWLNDRMGDWLGSGAIRYSMTITAVCAMVGGAILVAAARHSGRDAMRANG